MPQWFKKEKKNKTESKQGLHLVTSNSHANIYNISCIYIYKFFNIILII